jgi:hypothetical protein
VTDETAEAYDAGVAPFSTLIESAHRLGNCRWAEMRLFELLGGWVQSTTDPAVKIAFAANSLHHAEHAATLLARLPDAGDCAANLVTAAASPGVERVFETLALLADDQTLERLVGVYRVIVPALIVEYSTHLERTSEVADAAVRRSLRIVIDDESNDWRFGQTLVGRRLVDGDSVGRAAAFQKLLETDLVLAGGIAR